MSQSAKAKADGMQAKMAQSPQDPVTLPIRSQELEPVPTEHFKDLGSREELEKTILAMLKDDNVDAVGICGMGGAGKTTLAKEIRKKSKGMFDAIAMVEISEEADIARIQNHIAGAIDLSLNSDHSIEQRATRLYNELKRVKQKGSNYDQPTKILIIIDNIWTELKLGEVGIPRVCCKILFTSRERGVCKLMGVRDENIIDVGMLNGYESRCLFRELVGNHVVDRESNRYRSLEDRLLKTCEGLPLAITVLAKELRGEDLSVWRYYADELQKSISSRSIDVHKGTYKILGLSYKFIRDNDKKSFLLLACLFPLGSGIPIEDLMRYGIGLGLFQRVNSLTEAMKQATKWAEELISSSLLLEDDTKLNSKGQVKIHDVVRASAISIAEEDGHMFMVEGIPGWQLDETYETASAISLMEGQDYGRLKGMEFEKLHTLLLRGSPISQLDDALFQGMKGLKVLVLSDIYTPTREGYCLPKSITGLRNLRALHLENCWLHGYENIELISELVGLLVLSLRGSKVGRLPDGIRKLSNLRLLDLSNCLLEIIPVNVISCLTQLEGLYMQLGRNTNVKTVGDEACINEFKLLAPLKVLELYVSKIEQLPLDDEFVDSLERFKIHVSEYKGFEVKDQLSGALTLEKVSLESIWRCKCLKALLPKADYLQLSQIEGLKNLVPDLDTKGFRKLEILEISYSDKFERIWDGQAPPGMFSNLGQLSLKGLYRLQESYVLPLDVACKLITLTVSDCEDLKFIWMKHASDAPVEAESDIIQFPFLRVLKLSYLPCLLSVLGEGEGSTSTTITVPHALFGTKIVFPSLEELDVAEGNFVKLWDFPDPMEEMCTSNNGFSLKATSCGTKLHLSHLQNLRSIHIWCAPELKALGCPSIAAALVQLESLSISYCDSMEEVISKEREEAELISSKTIMFPKLEHLQLDMLCDLKCFYGGSYELQFPALKHLELYNLHSITRFAGAENSTAFFPKKMGSPCLEELRIESLNPEAITDQLWTTEEKNTTNLVPHLRRQNLSRLREIPDCYPFKSVRYLRLWKFNGKYLFSVEGVACGLLERLLHLEELDIGLCGKMEAVVEGESIGQRQQEEGTAGGEEIIQQDGVVEAGSSGATSSVIVFPHLKRIKLESCHQMRWFSSSAGHHHVVDLPSLQEVEIKYCINIESFSPGPFQAPKLSKVQVCMYLRSVPHPHTFCMNKNDNINNFLVSLYTRRNCP